MAVQVEHGIEVIVEVLCESGHFTDDEISLIEDYFEDGADEILEKLEYREDIHIAEKLGEELRWLIQSGKDEDVEKAAKLFFAVWELNASSCFPGEMFSEKCSVLASEPAIRTALLASNISICASRMRKPYLKKLMNYAHNDPEIVRKAFGYRGKNVSERIILLTVYFLLKYPEIKPEDGEGGLAAVLERQGITGDEAEQDIAMMKQYEDLLLSIFSEIYCYGRPKDVTDEIEGAIRDDRIDEEILKMAAADVPENCVKIYLDEFRRYHVGGMAFVNFALSRRLKNIVLVCLAARVDEMLYTIADLDMRGDFDNRGGSYDQIFGVDSYWLIRCAAVFGKRKILEEQFGRSREIYLKCMDDLNFTLYHYMSEVIRHTDARFHKEREQEELARQQGLLIHAILNNVASDFEEEMQKYLEGKTEMESLYPFCEEVWLDRGSERYWKMLSSYKRFYGYDAFCRKCEAALMICGGFDNFDYLLEDGVLKEERVRELFQAMDEMGLALRFQLKGFTEMYFSIYRKGNWLELFLVVGKDIFNTYYKERREEMQEAFQKAGRPGRLIALRIFSQGLECLPAEGEKGSSMEQESSMEQIIHFCQDPSDEVRDALVEILYRARNREEDVVRLLSSQVVDERKIAVRVLKRWEDDKYALILKESFIKEKNAELKALLGAVLPMDKLIRLEGDKALREIIKELHRGNKKRTLAWAYETPFSRVHKKDGEEADEEYLQAILLAYGAMAPKGDVAPFGVSTIAEALAGQLDEREYAIYVNELLGKWIDAGADTKKRWVLFAAANHGDEDMSARLFEAVQEWCGKRAPIALEVVRALCLSLRSDALLMVEELSRRSKVYKIREAAKKALDSTASWLGLTRSGLMDRTVLDLGFNEKRERIFDYGARRFIADISPDLEVRIFDESGKKLKNLPAPRKQDDEARASVAREEFSHLKKQVKTMVKNQKERLEEALSNVRMWGIDSWKELFFVNPVMYGLGMGLIWGIYEDGKLAAVFRYREDGIIDMESMAGEAFAEGELSIDREASTEGELFIDREASTEGELSIDREAMIEGVFSIDGEAFIDREVCIVEVHSIEEILSVIGCSLSENTKVALVHPLELSHASLKAWKEHLEEYEIVQPIEQLSRPVYRITEEEADDRNLERFKGVIMKGKVIKKELGVFGWITDLGEEIFDKENQELSMGAELGMEDRYEDYEIGEIENVTLYEVKFYDLSCKDDFNREYYFLKDVPERYFSEIVLELTRATAKCIRRDLQCP